MRLRLHSFFSISSRIFFLFLSLLSLSSCFKFNNTGNGEPYAGYETRDPGNTKTEAYLVSDKYELQVEYHDNGLHEVNVYTFNKSTKDFDLIKTSLTEKKRINGDRVYESQDLKINIRGTSADLTFKEGSSTNAPARLRALTYDCSDKLQKEPFAGGEGTQENPYKICSPEQLNNIRGGYLSSYFVLWSDLDLAMYAPNPASNGWDPIGDSSVPFSGNFDGNLFAIRGLEMRGVIGKNVSSAGLFGVVTKGGVLSNVNLVDVNMQGETRLGALAGEIAHARVINIQSSGSIYARLDSAGGVVGLVKNFESDPCSYSISRSTSSVNITTVRKGGGLVGTVDSNACSGMISDSSTSGTIESSGAGGLVGGAYATQVTRSWSTSTIVGNSNVGGLVGYAHAGSIVDSYYTGTITANSDGAGGILGLGFTDTQINRVYAKADISTRNNLGGILGRAQFSPRISNSFFTGNLNLLDPDSSDFGAIVGQEEFEGRLSLLNTFWYLLNDVGNLTCIGNRSNSRCGSGIAEEAPNEPYFFNPLNAPMDEWDFENVWLVRDGNLPVLRKVY